jgi:hypothetical protein
MPKMSFGLNPRLNPRLQIQIIFQILNLSSYTRLNPKHLLNKSLKSNALYQRYYSSRQGPRVHMWLQKSSLKGL